MVARWIMSQPDLKKERPVKIINGAFSGQTFYIRNEIKDRFFIFNGNKYEFEAVQKDIYKQIKCNGQSIEA